MLSCARALEEDYSIRFVDLFTMNNEKEMMATTFLATTCRAAYIHCISVDKIILRYQTWLCYHFRLDRDDPVVRTIGLKNLDKQSPWKFSRTKLCSCFSPLMCSSDNSYHPVRFLENFFYRHVRTLLIRLMIDVRNKTKGSFRPSCCFLLPRFTEPN